MAYDRCCHVFLLLAKIKRRNISSLKFHGRPPLRDAYREENKEALKSLKNLDKASEEFTVQLTSLKLAYERKVQDKLGMKTTLDFSGIPEFETKEESVATSNMLKRAWEGLKELAGMIFGGKSQQHTTADSVHSTPKDQVVGRDPYPSIRPNSTPNLNKESEKGHER